mgnify:CR=1 FL=1
MFSSEMAELLGMHVGDGTLYATHSSLVWELRGDLKEKEYYNNIVAPLLYDIFKTELLPKFRSGGKNGCFGIQTCNKNLISFFLKHGFKPGKKAKIVRIPKIIFNSKKEIQLSFLRGYFDTDGCLRYEGINGKKIRNYPKLEMGSLSALLIHDLETMLTKLGFNFYVWLEKRTNTSKICIAGKKMLEKWMEEVKPHNPKHLNKYFQNAISSAEVA